MKNSFPLKVFSIIVLFGCHLAFSQQDTFKSLLQQLEVNKSIKDEDVIAILEKTIGIKSLNTRDSLKLIIDKVTPYSETTENKRLQFLYRLELTRSQGLMGDYKTAFKTATTALENKDIGKVDELIFLYSLMGACTGRMGNYVEALEWHHEALKLCENKSEKSCLALCYTNIAAIYGALNDYEKVKDYSIKSYHIANSTGNTLMKTRASTNIAIAFVELKEYDQAEKWFLRNLTIEQQDTLSMITNYNSLGIMFEELENYQKSIPYLQKALDLALKRKDEAAIGPMFINLARNHNKNGNIKEAERLFKSGIKKAEERGSLLSLGDAYASISQFYETTRRPKKALEYFKKYHTIIDSTAGESQQKAVKELEVKYETQKKENDLLQLSKEKQENELTIIQQDRRVNQLTFGLGALVLLGILGFIVFRQQLRNKKQEELLLAISETQTDERKRIAQDLHDSIGGSLALTKSMFEAVKNKLNPPPSEMESALETLEQTTQQVRQISHNLMPGELVRFGLVAAIRTLLENLNKEEINAQFHTNQEENRLEPLKEIQLYRIVQEALQNVLKHAKAKNLYIQLNKHKDHLDLTIEDDGQGIAYASPEEGMGLKNIKQRVRLLKGIFAMDSSPEKGTILNIQIPV